MLAVIDYGAGNLRSVLHALNHLGVQDLRVVHTSHELRGAEKIILPGVGAFGAGMQKLHQQGIVNAIKEAVYSGVPYLGICLGMQFLFETSDEIGLNEGLGLIPGHVTRFPTGWGIKIPHIGWNQLTFQQPSPLTAGINNQNSVYFVHSYYCAPTNQEHIIATVDYGQPFTAAVQRDHIFGVQFHPEKSQSTGLMFLRNFLEITA